MCEEKVLVMNTSCLGVLVLQELRFTFQIFGSVFSKNATSANFIAENILLPLSDIRQYRWTGGSFPLKELPLFYCPSGNFLDNSIE